MPLFSERNAPQAKKVFKTKDNMSLDNKTRTKIWNYFYRHLQSYLYDIVIFYWEHILIQPIHMQPYIVENGKQYNDPRQVLMYWILDSEWEKVFDLIEITYLQAGFGFASDDFVEEINKIFETENIGYRLSNGECIPISSIEEVEEIEKAQLTGIEQVNYHLDKAIHHLSNREKPDYSNSIKESISAVEFLCRAVAETDTLGKALGKLESKGININGQFKTSLSTLYSYTNNKEDGIRHALMEKNTVIDQEDAKFMLVACSTFINYFIVKADKAGLKIK